MKVDNYQNWAKELFGGACYAACISWISNWMSDKISAIDITRDILAGVEKGYIEDDGLETVKNQGRQDIKDKWSELEDKWVDIIEKQTGDKTIQWINPSEHLSYQMPEKPFEIYEEDFKRTMMNYIMFKEGIDAKEFADNLTNKVLYSSEVEQEQDSVLINIVSKGGSE